jgi:hypothetical protein
VSVRDVPTFYNSKKNPPSALLETCFSLNIKDDQVSLIISAFIFLPCHVNV